MKNKKFYRLKGWVRQQSGSIVLVAVSVVLSFTVLGGLLLFVGLKNRMETMDRRLGADLMVVPDKAKESVESVLLTGSRDYIYFNKNILGEMKKIPEVSEATQQFFLASLSEKCCADSLEIVGFDPETDFIIEPWVKGEYHKELADYEAVAGSDVALEKDKTIHLFGKTYKVAARLERTATSMDTSVYFPLSSIPGLIADAQEENLNFLDSQKDPASVSTVFVNLKDGQDRLGVTKAIYETSGEKVKIVYPKPPVRSFSQNVSGILSGMKVFTGVAAAGNIAVVFLVYRAVFPERKSKKNK